MIRQRAWLIVFGFVVMGLARCSSPLVSDNKLKRIQALPIGYDKAAVLREFGPPIKIEMVDKRLTYTYVNKEKRKVISKVTLVFDEKNKITGKTIK